MTIMLTVAEQQELCHIEEELTDADPGFARQLTLLQGMLRWVGPGRQVYLPVLTVLTSALLRLAGAAERLLMASAEGAVLMEPAVPMVLGYTAWPGMGVRAGARS